MITSHSVGEAWVYPRAFLGRGGQGVLRKVLELSVFYKAFLSESLTEAMITLHLVGGVWDYQLCNFFHGRVGSILGNPFVASIVVFQICFQVAGPWTSTHFYLRSSEMYFWTLCCVSGLFWVISEGAGWTSCVHSRSRRGCPPYRWQLCPPMAIYPKIHSSINPNIYNISIHISINLIIHPPLPRAARS